MYGRREGWEKKIVRRPTDIAERERENYSQLAIDSRLFIYLFVRHFPKRINKFTRNGVVASSRNKI